MEAPLSKLTIYMEGCSFVDDTDIIQLGLNDDDYWVVASKLQEALKWWDICKKLSGVTLVPSKSRYVLVDFE